MQTIFTLLDGRVIDLNTIPRFHGMMLYDLCKDELSYLLSSTDETFRDEKKYPGREFTLDQAVDLVISTAMDDLQDEGRETYFTMMAEAYADNEMVTHHLLSVVSEYPTVLKAIPYKQYLQTDHWQSVRKEALERAGGRCQVCNANDRLHTHHRSYERRGEEMPSDVIVLCASCHKLFHDNGKLARGES